MLGGGGKIVALSTLQEGSGTAAHMLFKCRYSLRIWRGIKEWLGLFNLDMSVWSGYDSVKAWWCSITRVQGRRRKGLSSLLLLVSWEIWNERNARVFRNVASMPSLIISNIKRGAGLWGMAGAKHLCNIMPRE